MRAVWATVGLGLVGLGLACRHSGRQYADGDTWTYPPNSPEPSFVMRCTKKGRMFLVEVAACIGPGGERVGVGQSLQAGNTELTCSQESAGKTKLRIRTLAAKVVSASPASTSSLRGSGGRSSVPASQSLDRHTCATRSGKKEHMEEWQDGNSIMRCEVGAFGYSIKAAACVSPSGVRVDPGEKKRICPRKYVCEELFGGQLLFSDRPDPSCDRSPSRTASPWTPSSSGGGGGAGSFMGASRSALPIRPPPITQSRRMPESIVPEHCVHDGRKYQDNQTWRSRDNRIKMRCIIGPMTFEVVVEACVTERGTEIALGRTLEEGSFKYSCKGNRRSATLRKETRPSTTPRSRPTVRTRPTSTSRTSGSSSSRASSSRPRPSPTRTTAARFAPSSSTRGKPSASSVLSRSRFSDGVQRSSSNGPTARLGVRGAASKTSKCVHEGLEHDFGREFSDRANKFIKVCEKNGRGFKVSTLACLTTSGTRITVGQTVEEDGQEFECFPLGSRATLRVNRASRTLPPRAALPSRDRTPFNRRTRAPVVRPSPTRAPRTRAPRRRPSTSAPRRTTPRQLSCRDSNGRMRSNRQQWNDLSGGRGGTRKVCEVRGGEASVKTLHCLTPRRRRVQEGRTADERGKRYGCEKAANGLLKLSVEDVPTTPRPTRPPTRATRPPRTQAPTPRPSRQSRPSVSQSRRPGRCEELCSVAGRGLCLGDEVGVRSFDHGMLHKRCMGPRDLEDFCVLRGEDGRDYEVAQGHFVPLAKHLLACVVFEDTSSMVEPFKYANDPKERAHLRSFDYKLSAAQLYRPV